MGKNTSISAVWICKTCKIQKFSNHNYIQCGLKISQNNLKNFVPDILTYYENTTVGCTYCKNDVNLSFSLIGNYLAIDCEHQNLKIDLFQIQETFVNNAKTYFLCGAVEVVFNEISANKDYVAYCRIINGKWFKRSTGYKPFRNIPKKNCLVNLALLIYTIA